MRLPTPLAAVVFDMDGTLLDTETLYEQVMMESARDMGRTLTEALHLSLIGTPAEEGDRLILEAFGAGFDVEAFRHRVHHGLEVLAVQGVPLKRGALELLTFLRARGVGTGLATSTARNLALPRLERSGIASLLDVVVTRCDVKEGKPHPESYLTAARGLGAAPQACIAVEDSHTGVRSAAASGMATIMTPDLLAPTPQIAALCVAVVDGLDVLHQRLAHHLG
jgi:HAD superfamily hydrolase (TIGR01509 family)